jgi:hypothetical protein
MTNDGNKATPSSMAGRLGHVLGWIANLIALVAFGIGVLAALDTSDARLVGVGVAAVIAVIIWLIGRALRYVLAGR